MMRILHGPNNIGGMPHLLAKSHRDMGETASSYSMYDSPYQFSADITLDIKHRPQDFVESVVNALKFPLDYDIFQFYYGESLTGPALLDIPYLKALNKKIFFYFCGCDIRDAKQVISQYDTSACHECWPSFCSQNRLQAREAAYQYADGVFVSTPDLLEFMPQAVWLPQPVDIDSLQRLKASFLTQLPVETQQKILKVAHAPTNRLIKGTHYVEKSIQLLQSEGHAIELILIENMPHEKALQAYYEADIIIDQLLIGWYGQVSLEMMALGKPVICYLREDLVSLVENTIPIINASPQTLTNILRDLIKSPHSFETLGQAGLEYVQKNHDAKRVAQRALDYYAAA